MLTFEFQSYLKMQLFFVAAVRHIEALNLNKNFSLFSPPHTLYWAVIHSHSRKTKLSWNNLDDRCSLTVCSSQKKKKKITSQQIFDLLSISRSILQWQIKTSVQWTLTLAWMQLSLVLYSFSFFLLHIFDDTLKMSWIPSKATHQQLVVYISQLSQFNPLLKEVKVWS